jgi:hypothetical protein
MSKVMIYSDLLCKSGCTFKNLCDACASHISPLDNTLDNYLLIYSIATHNLHWLAAMACEIGNLPLLRYCYYHNAKIYMRSDLAIEHNYVNIVKFMLDTTGMKSIRTNIPSIIAKYGSHEMIDLILKYIDDSYIGDFTYNAARYHNSYMIDALIKLNMFEPESCLAGAATGGNLALYMQYELIAPQYTRDRLDSHISSAANHNQLDMMKYLLNKIEGDKTKILKEAMRSAAASNIKNIIARLESFGIAHNSNYRIRLS